MIENPSYSRKFYGEYDLVSPRRLDLKALGNMAAFVSCFTWCSTPSRVGT